MPKSPRVSGFAHNQRLGEGNECVLEVELHEMPCCSYLASDYDLLNIQGVPEKREVQYVLAAKQTMHRRKFKLYGNVMLAVGMERRMFENICYPNIRMVERDRNSLRADAHLSLI